MGGGLRSGMVRASGVWVSRGGLAGRLALGPSVEGLPGEPPASEDRGQVRAARASCARQELDGLTAIRAETAQAAGRKRSKRSSTMAPVSMTVLMRRFRRNAKDAVTGMATIRPSMVVSSAWEIPAARSAGLA